MSQTFVGIISFVAVIIGMVLVHEFGHFLASKLLKVEVEEFGIGFPPRLLTLFEAGGTKFTLNAIPLGGFVRPKGENDPEVPGGLAAASPWVRLGVLFAGPIMNLLLAVILYVAIFAQVGVADTSKVLIMEVTQGSPAQTAGLQAGDIITSINGTPVNSADTLQKVSAQNLGQPVTIGYERNGQPGEVTLTPRANPPAGEGPMGVGLGSPRVPAPWYKVLPEGLAATGEHIKLILSLPVQLARGQLSPTEGRLVGFKGMFDMYQEVRTSGPVQGIPPIVNVLLFFTNITISLGILNLFPFPSLDGGRILFTLPEIIFRKRIPQKYENVINLVGFAVLIILLLYINLQDFISPATFPR